MGKKAKGNDSARFRMPLSYRMLIWLLDEVMPHVRIVLFPFKLLTYAWGAGAQIIWFLSNEYSKRSFGSCGKGVRVYGRFNLTAPGSFYVGDNVHINSNAFLRTEGGLHIGDNVHISRNVVIYTVNHNYQGKCLPYDETVVLKSVHIERNVWIGMNVVVTPGVTIGEGAIIGMGSVVSKDVPPLAIVGSVPLRQIKMRDSAHYQRIDKERCFGGMSGYKWPSSTDAESNNHCQNDQE